MKKFWNKNKIFVISGPSGVGKSSVCKRLLANTNLKIKRSISYTTRKKRIGEIDKKNYFFVSEHEFKTMINHGELLEYIVFHNNYYGTSKKQMLNILNHTENNLLLEIDVEGEKNIRRQFSNVVSIFLVPPTFGHLQDHIRFRGTENNDQMQKRLAKAVVEMKTKETYDYQVVNDTIQDTVQQITTIIKKEVYN